MLRACRVALLPLLLVGGCALPERGMEPSSWLSRLRANPVEGPHAVLEVALVERPPGDAYVNGELWQHIDELVVDLERRAALDENGVRVGQLVGTPPHGFQTLLLSHRSCSNPHALLLPPGRTVPLYLGPVLAKSSFELAMGKERSEVKLEQARYAFEVTPTLLPDGQTRLTFTPRVEHGEPTLPFEPSPDEATWTLRVDKPNKKYPDLSFDVTLPANRYLIIGSRADRPGSLGDCAFRQDDQNSVQRLLVIRVGASAQSCATVEDTIDTQCPPLALRAINTTARAKLH